MFGGRSRLLVLLALSCASAEEKPDGPIIDSFVIDGTHELKPRDIKKRVLSSASFLPWLPFFGKEEHFDQNAWSADQRRVERFYQAHGFYQARVVDEEVKELKEGHVALRFQVLEGKPTHIERIDVKGFEPLTDKQRKALLEKLPVKDGRIFLEDEWVETQRLLTERMLKLGYAGSTLDAKALVDVGKQTADLHLDATLGQRYRFDRIYISNPDGKVDARLIRDQVASVVEEGEWFTPEVLEEAQARVFKMGVFSAVKVNRGALNQQTGKVPVTVDVREAPFTTWRAGGGFGGDPLRNDIHGLMMYENRNFLGGTRRLTLAARVGYTFLSAGVTSGFFAFISVLRKDPGSQHGPVGSITFEVEQPHFLHRSLAVQLTIEPSYTIEPAYRAGGASATASLVWRPSSHLTASLSYDQSVYALSAPVSLAANTTRFVGCGTICVLQYFQETIAWDRRDDPLEPHEGWYTALHLQQGGDTLVDGGFLFFNFFRFTPDVRGYVSFFDRRLTLAARARLGVMLTRTGNAPIPVRYFSGGNEMRGFSARRLAPYDVVPLTNCNDLGIDQLTAIHGVCPGPGEVLPVGGNTLFDASFEIRWNVWDWVTIALFMDAGYVTALGLTSDLFSSLNYAVGLGGRFRTPIGPIRVDLAWRLPFIGAPLERLGPQRENAVVTGCFGIGLGPNVNFAGSPEGQCVFHVSVGEAF